MRTELNERLIGTKPRTRNITTQIEARNELLRVREYMKRYQPLPFHYSQSQLPRMEFCDLLEAEECRLKKEYVILLHKVDNFFAISDFSCPAIYASLMMLLNRI